tara:strand:+ start:911 stop:1537 length:627 start_codon:yes stop_codon:yes gene_type:complete
MFKPCYELKLEIPSNFKERVDSIWDDIKNTNRKYRQPEALYSEYPELWDVLGPLKEWFAPKVRVINHTTDDLGTSAIHLDVNEHYQYENISEDAITQCALNVPLFKPVGDITRWWRQKNPDVIMPADFWIGDGKDFSTAKTNNNIYDMECIDEFEIKENPVLFRTGIWHSCEQANSTVRTMLSFHAHYTIDWDTLVSTALKNDLLIER